MAYLPPVNLPNLQDRDYAAQLHGMIGNVGEAYYGAKRDKIGDAQWQQEQERLSTAQALAQSNADRNYALELEKWQWEQANPGTDTKVYGSGLYYPDPNSQTGFGYGVWDQSGQMQGLEAPGGPVTVPAGPHSAGGAGWMPRTYASPGFLPPTTMVTTTAGEQPVSTRGGIPTGPGPVPGSAPGAIKAANEAGVIQGGAVGNLPAMKKNAEYVKAQIDGVMNDPDLALVTGGGGEGGFGGLLPADFSVWGDVRDKGRNIQSKVDFVKAQVFPIAYDLIRGAGPIAIYESQAAAAAIARLEKQNLSDADYKTALADFKIKLDAMIAAVEAKAGGGGPQAPAGGGAPVGSTLSAPAPGGGTVNFKKVGQ